MLAESQMNLILNDMTDELNSEQLRKLKCSIIMRTSESTLSTEVLLPNEMFKSIPLTKGDYA